MLPFQSSPIVALIGLLPVARILPQLEHQPREGKGSTNADFIEIITVGGVPSKFCTSGVD